MGIGAIMPKAAGGPINIATPSLAKKITDNPDLLDEMRTRAQAGAGQMASGKAYAETERQKTLNERAKRQAGIVETDPVKIDPTYGSMDMTTLQATLGNYDNALQSYSDRSNWIARLVALTPTIDRTIE